MNNESIWIVIAIGIVVSLLSVINQLRADITRMRLTVDKIAKQVGVPDIVTEEEKNKLKALILEGKKVTAIKRYRGLTGIGLKEAKEYIDELMIEEIGN